jgi:medium-chain acyl-[acyl-carrier-protein] hydrolase
MDGLTTTRTTAGSEWQMRWRPVPAPRLRLYCLPHAGGGAVSYRAWAQHLAADIEVVAIRLPGRESRHRETPYTRLDGIVAGLIEEVSHDLVRLPYAWFGHSLGALVAFETCREAQRLGLPDPVRLLVSGRPAPHLIPRQPPVHAAPTARIMDRLREMKGTPPEFLEDPSAMAGVLPTLRADLAAAETYQYRPGPPLGCPISVFGGAQDPFATADELSLWRGHSAASCTMRTFPGGHFYLHESHHELLPVIDAELRSSLERRNETRLP